LACYETDLRGSDSKSLEYQPALVTLDVSHLRLSAIKLDTQLPQMRVQIEQVSSARMVLFISGSQLDSLDQVWIIEFGFNPLVLPLV
jgi:hypothetical protein